SETVPRGMNGETAHKRPISRISQFHGSQPCKSSELFNVRGTQRFSAPAHGSGVVAESSAAAREGSPVVRERSPVVREGSPVAREGSPVARERSPVAREGSPVVREGSRVAREDCFSTPFDHSTAL